MRRHRIVNILIFLLFLSYASSPLFHSSPGVLCPGDGGGAAGSLRGVRVFLLELLYSEFFDGPAAGAAPSSDGIILQKKRAVLRGRPEGRSIAPLLPAPSAAGLHAIHICILPLLPRKVRPAAGGLLAFTGLSPPSSGLSARCGIIS